MQSMCCTKCWSCVYHLFTMAMVYRAMKHVTLEFENYLLRFPLDNNRYIDYLFLLLITTSIFSLRFFFKEKIHSNDYHFCFVWNPREGSNVKKIMTLFNYLSCYNQNYKKKKNTHWFVVVSLSITIYTWYQDFLFTV